MRTATLDHPNAAGGRSPAIRTRKGAETRRAILLAAADLFAERGVDNVAPREILERADQRNAAAIGYYFGSRDALVHAVIEPRPDVRDPIDEARLRRLHQVLDRDVSPPIEAVVGVLVEPVLLCLDTHEGRSFVRVAAQVVRSLPIEDRASPRTGSVRLALDLIATRLPQLSDEIRLERLGTAHMLLVELVANRAREIEHGIEPNLTIDAFGAELTSMLVGLLAAPARDGIA